MKTNKNTQVITPLAPLGKLTNKQTLKLQLGKLDLIVPMPEGYDDPTAGADAARDIVTSNNPVLFDQLGALRYVIGSAAIPCRVEVDGELKTGFVFISLRLSQRVYLPVDEANVPAGMRWDTPPENDGQHVVVSWSWGPKPMATCAVAGAQWRRITDRSLPVGDVNRVTYARTPRSTDLGCTQAQLSADGRTLSPAV